MTKNNDIKFNDKTKKAITEDIPNSLRKLEKAITPENKQEKNNFDFKLKGKIVNENEFEKALDGMKRLEAILTDVKNNKQYDAKTLIDKVRMMAMDNDGDVANKEVMDTAELMMIVSMKEAIKTMEDMALNLGKHLGVPDHVIMELVLDRFMTLDKKQENYFNEFSINGDKLKDVTHEVIKNEISMHNDAYKKMGYTIPEEEMIKNILNDKTIKSMNNIKDIDDDEIMDISIQSAISSFEADDIIAKCDGAFKKCNSCIGLSDEGICEVTGANMNSVDIKVCNDFESK